MTPFIRSLSNSSELKAISFGGNICTGGQSTKSTLKLLRVLRICGSEVNSLHSGNIISIYLPFVLGLQDAILDLPQVSLQKLCLLALTLRLGILV